MRRLLAVVIAAFMGAALIVSLGPARPSLASPRSPVPPPGSPRAQPPPEIFGLAPVQGPVAGGTRVTIVGSGFTTAASVEFGGIAASSVHVLSPSVLTAVAPAGAGRENVVVTTAFGSSAQSSRTTTFDYVVAPAVTAVSPASGPTNGTTSVTVTGTGFTAGARVLGTTAPASILGGHIVFLPGGRDIWTDSGLKPGRTYTYAVLAIEGSGYAQPATITVTVPAHPELSGTVTDSAGDPITGVTVNVLSAGGTEASHATTGDNGSWTVAGLSAGAYTVCFEPAGGATGAGGHGFLPQCWQDTSPDSTPAPVTVDPAATRTGLDATLADAGGISGTITSTSGRPVPGAVAVIYDGSGEPAASAAAAADGTWQVSGLPDGSYTACFYPPDDTGPYDFQCYNTATPATAQPITVTSGATVTGIDAALRPATSAATTAATPAAMRATPPGIGGTTRLLATVRPRAALRGAGSTCVAMTLTLSAGYETDTGGVTPRPSR